MDYSRREFLRRSGIALAGAALAPGLAMAENAGGTEKSMETSSKKIRRQRSLGALQHG